MIYMDNSATSYPKPPEVRKAVFESLDKYFANPGRSSHTSSVETAGAVFASRLAVADFVTTDPEKIVFTYNATMALNMAILGAVDSGKRVATSLFEHNSVLRPLYRLEREKGVKIAFLKSSTHDGSVLVSDFEELVKSAEKPDFLVLTHTSNVTGCKMPVRELGAICRREKIVFILDASQGLGTSRVNMEECGIDILCSSGHKGLFGISGSGFLAVSKTSNVKLSPILTGGAGILSREKNMPSLLPDGLEAGTLGVAGALSIGAGIEYIQKVGCEELCYNTGRLRRRLLEGISTLSGYDLIAPSANAVSIVLFNKLGLPSEALCAYLDENKIASRAGLHCAPLAHDFLKTPNGAVRLSVSAFNTFDECDEVLKVLSRF